MTNDQIKEHYTELRVKLNKLYEQKTNYKRYLHANRQKGLSHLVNKYTNLLHEIEPVIHKQSIEVKLLKEQLLKSNEKFVAVPRKTPVNRDPLERSGKKSFTTIEEAHEFCQKLVERGFSFMKANTGRIPTFAQSDFHGLQWIIGEEGKVFFYTPSPEVFRFYTKSTISE